MKDWKGLERVSYNGHAFESGVESKASTYAGFKSLGVDRSWDTHILERRADTAGQWLQGLMGNP